MKTCKGRLVACNLPRHVRRIRRTMGIRTSLPEKLSTWRAWRAERLRWLSLTSACLAASFASREMQPSRLHDENDELAAMAALAMLLLMGSRNAPRVLAFCEGLCYAKLCSHAVTSRPLAAKMPCKLQVSCTKHAFLVKLFP